MKQHGQNILMNFIGDRFYIGKEKIQDEKLKKEINNFYIEFK